MIVAQRTWYDPETQTLRTENIKHKDFYAMDNYTAVGLAEGFIDAEDEDQVIAAWQHLHTTGLAYQLQGFFGRTAQHLLNEGIIQ